MSVILEGDRSQAALLTVKAVARSLGWSDRMTYRRIAEGHLPGVLRIGGSLYVKRAEFERWLGLSQKEADGRG